MAAIGTALRTEIREIALPEPLRVFIPCDHCGSRAVPGLTFVTLWGMLCAPYHDDYETAHGAGEEGF